MEHLKGRNHQKKEAVSKNSAGAAMANRTGRQFYCELCDVACTCIDTYTAHLRGVKHQKVMTTNCLIAFLSDAI